MRQLTGITTVLLITLMAAGSAFADTTIRYQNAKTLAMGDTRIAGGYGYNGFIDNPALLSRVSVMRVSVIPVSLGVDDNFYDIVNFVDDNQKKFEDFDDPELMTVEERQAFLDDIVGFEAKWGRLSYSPMVALSTNIMGYGIGVAVFNGTEVGLKMDQGIYEPRVWGEGFANTAIVLGMSKDLPLVPGLTVGANIKYVNRRSTGVFQISATDLGSPEDTLDPIVDRVKDQKENTLSADLGAMMYLPVIDADVAGVLHSIGDGRASSLDFGISRRFLGDNLVMMADYVDFYDNNRENIFKKIHFGAEYRYMFMALRGGINAGYPSLGLGLDFKVFDLDLTYFTQEMTKVPGGLDNTQYIVQMKFGW